MAYYPYQYPQMLQTPQAQNNNIISVRNEQEARNYPVAYGNSVTFKDESTPYIYTKTMGFSQLDKPVFKRYQLTEVVDDSVEKVEEKSTRSDSRVDNIQEQIDALWKEINYLKKKRGGNNEHNADSKSV